MMGRRLTCTPARLWYDSPKHPQGSHSMLIPATVAALAVLGFAAALPESASAQALKYPKTRKANQVDDYHGTKVADPYRWLEDANSKETGAWVTEQNEVTEAYLNKLPMRDRIRARLTN